jgi:hypothetical protein
VSRGAQGGDMFVTIDGRDFELNSAALRGHPIVEALGPIVARQLARLELLTGEEHARLSRDLDQLTRIIAIVPDAVHARLTDEQRVRLFHAFITRGRHGAQ